MPGASFDAEQKQFLARVERQSIAPATIGAVFRQMYATDIRAVLPTISAPTLVLHAVGEPLHSPSSMAATSRRTSPMPDSLNFRARATSLADRSSIRRRKPSLPRSKSS